MNWKIIFSSLKDKDMRNRILAVLAMLLIFRILAHIPIPLSDPKTLKQVLETIYTSTRNTQLLSFLDVLSGGALANFSIMLIGLSPYINASIIMQLLTRAIPQLETLNKEGEYGRKKINQYTRILTLPLAMVQSVGAIYFVRQTAASAGGLGDITAHASLAQWALMIAAMTGASMMLMWLGELITEQGIGNGISLVITVGIVSSLPKTIGGFAANVISKTNRWHIFGLNLPLDKKNLLFAAITLLAVIIVTVLVVKLNEASRNLTIHYAKRIQGNRTYGGVTTILPVKLVTAGVVPIIFAMAFLSVPQFAGRLLVSNSSQHLKNIGTFMGTWFQTPNHATLTAGGWKPLLYPAMYFLLVFVFTFFYTSITFDAKEIAENLQKQGGFIEGVRSGARTERYLSKTINRLTFFGALALGLLAMTPLIAQYFISGNVAFSGTSILILVAVAIETLRQIESRALMVTYDQYEQPDFFYDNTGGAAALNVKKLRFLPNFRRKK